MSACPACGHSLASKADVSAYELREETGQDTVILEQPLLLQTLHPDDQPLIFVQSDGSPPVLKGVAIVPLHHGEKMIWRYMWWGRFKRQQGYRWARFVTWARFKTWSRKKDD